jgi:hypothetical protein
MAVLFLLRHLDHLGVQGIDLLLCTHHQQFQQQRQQVNHHHQFHQ